MDEGNIGNLEEKAQTEYLLLSSEGIISDKDKELNKKYESPQEIIEFGDVRYKCLSETEFDRGRILLVYVPEIILS